MFANLEKIDFGEPDANAEFVAAKRMNTKPIFLSAHIAPPLQNLERFENGTKFFILGQKGTGKTAILRYLEAKAQEVGRRTNFVIFRNEILEEKDLLQFNWPVLVDEEKIKSTKHYLHCIKRVLIALILKLALEELRDKDITEAIDDDGFWASFKKSVKTSAPARVVQVAFDSIFATLQGASIDVSKLSQGKVAVDPSRALKRENDKLLERACEFLAQANVKISIFVDEIHFAYRDEETLQQDAMLVRDTILAITNLNERFVSENLDCVIYAGFRSEFLDHPIIAAAEVNNTYNSYGENLSWSSFLADGNHPIFGIAAKRISNSIGASFSSEDLLRTYLKDIDAREFVEESTWSKPRDIIRFFNVAKKMYPKKVSLSYSDYHAVRREYSNQSWLEIKTAATAFLPPNGIAVLEQVLRTIGPKTFQQGYTLTMGAFETMLKPVYAEIKSAKPGAYDEKHLVYLLYILGIYSTMHRDPSGQAILYSFHRGNRFPSDEGRVLLHRAVARAFS